MAAVTAGMRERRYPTGLTTWGPLPGTGTMHILWPGPGSGLFLVIGQPDTAGSQMTRIGHASASGSYDTRTGARRAVQAFIAADGVISGDRRARRLTRLCRVGAPRWLRLAGRFYARNVPQLGAISTRPSSARARRALLTVRRVLP